MRFPQGKTIRLWILLGAGSLLVACSASFRNHGYLPTDEELANIQVGVDTRDSVEQAIGRPSSTGVLETGGWYYVSSRTKYLTYRKPEVVERQLLALSFDTRGVVSNIERFSLEDGRVVTLSRRVTSTGIKGPGFFAQIFGNFGNLDSSQFFKDE